MFEMQEQMKTEEQIDIVMETKDGETTHMNIAGRPRSRRSTGRVYRSHVFAISCP